MNFKLKIVTPTKVAVDLDVKEVMLCGVDGYFTIYANHSPFVSQLAISSGYYYIENTMYSFSIKGGFATVEENEVYVITSKFVEEDFKKSSEAYESTISFKTKEVLEVESYFDAI